VSNFGWTLRASGRWLGRTALLLAALGTLSSCDEECGDQAHPYFVLRVPRSCGNVATIDLGGCYLASATPWQETDWTSVKVELFSVGNCLIVVNLVGGSAFPFSLRCSLEPYDGNECGFRSFAWEPPNPEGFYTLPCEPRDAGPPGDARPD
jgi:hypothetical protein